MGLLFGAITALCLGTSDFFAARAGRSVPAFTVTRTAVLTAGVVSPVLLLITASHFGPRDSLIAALSGVVMGSGLTMLYEGYRSSRIGIVGPTSSVLVALVPVLYDLSRHIHLRATQTVGMAIGIVALGLTSYAPGGTGRALRGFVLGSASGICFGVAFTLMSRTSKASGLSTVVVQRWAAFAFLSLLLPMSGGPLVAKTAPARPYAMAAGLFAAAGLGALQLGFRHGAAGPVSVAASQFATVAVLLAVAFNGEKLRAWQIAGVGSIAVAVALMALG